MDPEYFNRITSTYGIGVDEFLDLFAGQQHRCAVCGKALVLFSTDRTEAPVVDHNHETGVVRGILCHPCNVAVGWIEKRPKRTLQAMEYISRNRAFTKRPPKCQSKNWSPKDWAANRRGRRALLNIQNRGGRPGLIDVPVADPTHPHEVLAGLAFAADLPVLTVDPPGPSVPQPKVRRRKAQ